MKIANGIEMLELTMNVGGNPMLIHPTVVYDSNSYVLIDTGLPGYYKEIMELIHQSGFQTSKLHSIILTHQDIDHIGGLPQFLIESKRQLDVYAHEADKPYIDGEKPLIKLTPERKAMLLQLLPEEQRQQFESVFSHSTQANVNLRLAGGEMLPFGGGMTVIHTPGHTPGHISLYHQPSKTLIAGDAMIVDNGELLGPKPSVTPDMETALKSLQKLTEFPIETVICYHGGIYKNNINQRLAELAAQS
jgi:glyoxylase-like metal-dependent hydrolase (beta-lactamase superfamily II)